MLAWDSEQLAGLKNVLFLARCWILLLNLPSCLLAYVLVT